MNSIEIIINRIKAEADNKLESLNYLTKNRSNRFIIENATNMADTYGRHLAAKEAAEFLTSIGVEHLDLQTMFEKVTKMLTSATRSMYYNDPNDQQTAISKVKGFAEIVDLIHDAMQSK